MSRLRMNLSVLTLAMALVLPLLPSAGSGAQSRAGNHAFQITSIGTAFGVQGEFLGDYHIEHDAISVHVTKASLYASEDCPYQGRREILEINFGLATETPNGKWTIRTLARPITLRGVMRPGDKKVFNGLDYQIPLSRNTDLRNHWFVVAIKEEILDPPRTARLPLRGTNFAHSCKNIFQQGFDPLRPQPNVPARGSPRYCP